MSLPSPSRPSRRAAGKRNLVLEDSDEENIHDFVKKEDDDEFTPTAQHSPRRSTRRRATDMPQTPRAYGRTRGAKTGDAVAPVETLEAPRDRQPASGSPTKRESPQKRKRGRPPAINRDNNLQSNTVQPSETSECLDRSQSPLADITQTMNNRQIPPKAEGKALVVMKPMETTLEKPMDIVIRSRALMTAPKEEETGPKSRTVIKSLALTNFKSYAGRQEVGPFHASFSSVVGPNGSGKSNVIDSLLFVFGFRASKMRQGKISALIHNSAAFPDLDFCEVAVQFQEVMDLQGGDHEVLADSDLVISRKAFKNNSSKYYINSRESNFTDVTNLLKEKGIDLDHKRFLILQGEVESIAQMKPKAANEHDDGLLEYLEDIIGTSKYKAPIDESATQVDDLNEICTEKSSRVQHVEKEKNNLEGKKDQALAFVRDENELAFKQSALYQVYIDECGDNLKVTDEAIAQMQEHLNGELQKHGGTGDEIKELEKAYKQGSKEIEGLQKITQTVLKEMAKNDKEKVKQEEKAKFFKSKQSKQEKALHSGRLAVSEARSLIQKHSDDFERNTKEIDSLEKEMEKEDKDLAAIRNSLKGKTQGLTDQIALKQRSLEPWNERINEKESSIAVTQSELEILRERASAGATAIEESRSRIAKLQADCKAKATDLKDFQAQKIQVEKDISKLHLELSRLAKQEPQFLSKLSGARQKADEARASLSSSQTQGNVLNGLMRLKDSGRIEGFHGRLGNLGTIDQKYDVAISTACPSLDNLVVDSVGVGQQCIEYLRKNNLGRANIILLDKLARRDLSPISTPEKVPRLFDLVKPKDGAFKPAFYSVLQNTLVAEDLDQAHRIAYGARRWRVVTLDGQLIDVSGTMSGGGSRVAKGAMSSKLIAETTKEQVSKLETERDSLEQVFQTHQQEQRDLESQLQQLVSQIPGLETDIQKTTLEIESLKRNIADIKRRVSELEEEEDPAIAPDQGRIDQLETQIMRLETEVQQLRAETAGLEGEIQQLQDKLMEVGGIKLRAQKAKVDGLKEQIDTLNEALSDAEIAKSKAEKQVEKHQKSYEEAEREISVAAEELASLDNEVLHQVNDASTSKKKVEEAQEAVASKQEELDSMKGDLEERRAALNQIRAVEIEMRNKLEENQKVQSDNQKRLSYWTEKLKKLSIQSISDLGEELDAQELPQYTKDELADMDKDTLKGEIAALEEKTQNASVEMGVLAEYRRRVEEHTSRSQDLQLAVSSRDTAKKRCDELRRLRLEGFMTGFSTISLRLKEMYQMITMGGNAELELVDSLDPFSEGILFSVMPPKKSWKNISNLSGGEKTLSSLALVFALHHYKPTPLYVMDEIDAALDFRNVSIVASYIKERTKNAQFVVISLRNNMFELASRLVGVYKVNHMTRSVTVENKDYIVRR